MEEHKTVLSHLTNEQIKEAIEFMIVTNEEFDGVNLALTSIKAREIGIYMPNLTNENDLEEIVEKIQLAGIIEYDNKQIKAIWSRLFNENGNTPVSASTKAKYYGIITQYLGFVKVANINPDVTIPELYVEYKDGMIYSNLNELIISTCRKLEFAKSIEMQKLPFEEQKLALKKDINEKLDFKLKRDSKFLDKYIEHSEKKLKYAFDNGSKKKKISNLNIHPNIFSGVNDYCTKLFDYLWSESNLKPKVKASTIYHYFKMNNYNSSNFTLEEYYKFLLDFYSISLSKVFQKNFKMEDNLNDTFTIFEENFKIQREEDNL